MSAIYDTRCSWPPKATGRNPGTKKWTTFQTITVQMKSRMAGTLLRQGAVLVLSRYLPPCPLVVPSTTPPLCHISSLWPSPSVLIGVHLHVCVHGFAHLCTCTEAWGVYWMSCSLFPPFDSLSLNLKHSVSHRLFGWVPGVYLPLLPNVGVAGMLTLCGCWVFELRSSRLEQKFLINWAISPIFVTLKAEPYPILPVSLPRFLAFLYNTNLSCT